MASVASVSTPSGFDPASTVILKGFPSTFGINDCRTFMSWFGPVVYVEKMNDDAGVQCYAVVFASCHHSENVLNLKTIPMGSNKYNLNLFSPQEMGSLWNTVGDMINNATSAPILQFAQDKLTDALGGFKFNLGGYLG
ncbi:hypothetical protein MACJ_003875 [Theileria orientalis]|uniref:RRM domain-containing protein n=1 Tax=Theileria orientalis TaxID=68886 RepID=A0A976XKF1_THEOR|nr:hypothetical protein MACJ_003875 [Theileria orientalis]